MPSRRRFSLTGKLTLLLCVVVMAGVGLTTLFTYLFDMPALAACLALLICVPLASWVAHWHLAPQLSLFRALSGSIASFRDGDFSFSLTRRSNDELDDLVAVHNELGTVLREER